jgi:hypothetical protein
MGLALVKDAPQPYTVDAPPYPAETTARHYRFELDMLRIEHSDTWSITPPEMRPWLLMLWAKAWMQVPAGSLPAEDEVIAGIIGMPSTSFDVHRKHLMRGWKACSDGRLYHPVLVERVLQMVTRRGKENERQQRHREMSRVTNAGVTMCTRTGSGSGSKEEVVFSKKEDSRASRFALSVPPSEWLEFCKTNRPDLNPQATFEKFRDYWTAVPGAKGRKLDWLATWRNFVRSEFAPRANVPQAKAWMETSSGVRAKGAALGILPEDFLLPDGTGRQDWQAFRAAVLKKAGVSE